MHMHFIKAQQHQPRFDDGPHHRLDRIGILALGALAERRHAGMDLVHEFVEMHPPLGDRRRGEKQVHQHGLAAPDLAMQVKSAHRLLGPIQQLVQQAARLAGLQPGQHIIEQPDDLDLGGIRAEGAARHQRAIGSADRSG